ncbi:hypothetical protein R1sor_027343 [Riccia sorocarpa]|uniref:Replitron HUH endonuclease domain-containing protein n=1 Tax=Riccia sorocarpa TaxID=122646 RepID=A0ABD3GH83_9MARC
MATSATVGSQTPRPPRPPSTTRLKAKARAKKSVAPEPSTRPRMKQTTLIPPRGVAGSPRKTKAEPKKSRRTPLKLMEVSLTVGQVAADVEADIFDKVALFIEKEASMGLIAFERGDTNLQLHIQGVMSLQASNVRSIKTDLTKAIGWDTNAPVGGVVCIKSVKNQGLHTVTGLIGYCLKDENELHFRLYSKNVTEQQMEDGRKRHMVFGASGYKNRLELTPQNLLCRALQFRRYRSKNPVTISFRHCIHEMARSGQYMVGLKWLLSPTVCNVRAERLWMFAVQPEAVSMADVDHIFFNFQQTARYYEGRRLQSGEELGADKPSEKELPKRYRTQKPPERSEPAESVWTEPHPKDFIDVDLQTLDPEEMQRLLKAGFGLTNRTDDLDFTGLFCSSVKDDTCRSEIKVFT